MRRGDDPAGATALKRIVTLHIRICVPLRGIAPTIGPCESGRHESNCYLLRLATLSIVVVLVTEYTHGARGSDVRSARI